MSVISFFFFKVLSKTQPRIRCTEKQKLYVLSLSLLLRLLYHSVESESKLRSTFGSCHGDCVLHCLHIMKFPSVKESTHFETSRVPELCLSAHSYYRELHKCYANIHALFSNSQDGHPWWELLEPVFAGFSMDTLERTAEWDPVRQWETIPKVAASAC